MTPVALPEMHPRIARLPKDERGYPVPWFIQWFDDAGEPCETGKGKPDFRVIAPERLYKAYKWDRCWVCGATIVGHAKVFVIGPMCVINRVTSEPPNHRYCAEFAAKVCPFLVRPRQKRNAKAMPEQHEAPPGIHLDRNPGAVALYQTGSYTPFKEGEGILFRLGRPIKVDWYANGRLATREEILDSIDGGLPFLTEIAEAEGPGAVFELGRLTGEAMKLLPA